MPEFPYYPYYDAETNTMWESPENNYVVTPGSKLPENITPTIDGNGVINQTGNSVADTTRFFSILPKSNNASVRSKQPIPLRVILDDGVKMEPDVEIKSTKLNGAYKIFKNNSGYNDSFTVSVMLNRNDAIEVDYERKLTESLKETDWDIYEKELLKSVGEKKATFFISGQTFKLTVLLDYWIKKGIPFYVHTDAIGINKKDLYLVTENKKRTQSYRGDWVEWDLTFTRYKEITKLTFNTNTTAMTKAMKKGKPLSAAAKARQKARQELAKCNRKLLVYSKKKKVVNCVKKLQQVLYLQKFLKNKTDIDGWYGKTTKNAVKAYQKKWSKDYGLKVTGNINPHTYQVMIGKGKKITKTTTTSKTGTTTIKIPVATGDGVITSANTAVTVKAVNATSFVAANKVSQPVTIDMTAQKVTTDTKDKKNK